MKEFFRKFGLILIILIWIIIAAAVVIFVSTAHAISGIYQSALANTKGLTLRNSLQLMQNNEMFRSSVIIEAIIFIITSGFGVFQYFIIKNFRALKKENGKEGGEKIESTYVSAKDTRTIPEVLNDQAKETLIGMDPNNPVSVEEHIKLFTKIMEVRFMYTDKMEHEKDEYEKAFDRINVLHYNGTEEKNITSKVWCYYNFFEMPKDFDPDNSNKIEYFITAKVYRSISVIVSEEDERVIYLSNALKDFSESTLKQGRLIGENIYEYSSKNKFNIKYLYDKENNKVVILGIY